ncbi:MAG: hypothetical protein KZQ95_08085 [Candidatus Thiodiazotropha sp. (ex Epidulcina cf. delphinae)]|nr:hypothetical protein [Candidatus Thiodiazotropha sp. (ex Epidulcina cf. delphinae)]
MMTRSNRLFLLVTLFILITDSYFVWLNYESARDVMQEGLNDELLEARGGFNLALDGAMDMLQQTALYIASDRRVQALFLAGRRAVESEGGGAGGIEAERIRKQLFELVGPGWEAMTERFNVRQLHFHLAPGALTFLRIHKRDKFGDRLDEMRQTVVDANVLRRPTRGFEIGRTYAGIRGVTPVYAQDVGTAERVHVGALEAGTSFPQILSLLRRHTHISFAVLLKQQRLDFKVWPESLKRLYEIRPPVSGFYIEASSDETMARDLLGLKEVRRSMVDGSSVIVEEMHHPLAVTSFPLYDYQGSLLADPESVGQILMWRDATASLAKFRSGVKNNILFAVAVFVMLEIIIYLGIGRVTRRLEEEVAEQTRQLRHANVKLEQRNRELSDSLGQLKTTQAQLIESEMMASLAGLVAGVAHEINTPVGTSVTAASHLVDRVDATSRLFDEGEMTRTDLARFFHKTAKACDIILSNLSRAGGLVKSFKRVAVDQSSLQQRRFDLCEYMEEIRLSLQPRLKKTPHRLILECEHGLELDSYPGALSQVLTNLVMNSLIHGFGDRIDPPGVMKVQASLINGNHVRLIYSDDGKGIAEQDVAHIFEPFFTTNRDGGSTGLGLNLVYNIITGNLGGTIRVESDMGVGTRFVIVFPRHHSQERGYG